MLARLNFAIAIVLLLTTSATAQVVRFETSLGDFDMVLNPTGEAQLQDYVDNFLNYVDDNRYLSSWINRASTGFVLQMGGFYSNTLRPPLTMDSVRPMYTYAPVAGQPANTFSNLSNTVGTVSLALPGDGMGGTNQDAGTSSFFINLTDNSFLDSDFTVFAAVPDMTVVNQIMALTTIDRTTDEMFGADPGNLTFTDVPVQDNGFQVFIKRAFVVTDSLTIAKALYGAQSVMAASAASYGSGSSAASAAGSAALASAVAADGSAASPSAALVVPEPATAALLLLGVLSALGCRRLGRR
jgi:cyclophilin family peptidyl-prolyl cis-trans isomerase